jgi:transcriptional regulator with XRE-family HTH domain
MSKHSASLSGLPEEVALALEGLGQRLRAYRVQRGQTVQAMAARLLCSPVTYGALEAGKPGTSLGVMAHALWLLGELDSLERIAPLDPAMAAAASGRRARARSGRSAPGTISKDERDF